MTPVSRWRFFGHMVLAGALGALAALGLAPYEFWPMTLIALASVPWLMQGVSGARRAGWIGWAFGAGYFAHALIWIVEPFLVDIGRHGWMAPFALVFLAGGLALFWAAAFGAAQRFSRGDANRIALLVLFLSLAEFARAYVLTGFPWAGLAQIWVGTEVGRSLAWIGPHGLSIVTLMAGLLPGLILIRRGLPVIWAGGMVPCGFLLSAGTVLFDPLPDDHPSTGTVRIVQPNAPQHQKWDPAMMPVFFERQIGYTAQSPRPDMVVWPETAVPTLLEYAAPAFERMKDAAQGAPMAVGVQRSEGARSFNSMVKLDEEGRVAAIYDKHHLVPFGEYFPGGDLAARFGLRGFAAQEGDGYSAGPGPQIMDFGALGRAVPLICYEAVFPQDVSGTPVRGDFLLQVTNDAWFGQFVGPYQHLAQARMRSIEQGLPMVRSANTGISAMIDPVGGIVASLPLGQAGYVDAALPAPLPPTLYARTGDGPVFGLLIVAVLACPILHRRKRNYV